MLPTADWAKEDLKPAFNNFLRRIDRIFNKISKRQPSKKQLDWTAIAGIMNGLNLTLEKQEFIASLPYFKILINSILSLILSENSDLSNGILTSGVTTNGGNPAAGFFTRGDSSLQIPTIFAKSLIKLVGSYINSLKEQFNLEVLLGSMNTLGMSMPASLIYLMNFMLPLLIWSASDRRNSPKFNKQDMNHVVMFLLNSLKPPSKLAATLLLQAPKQQFLTPNNEANAGGNAFNKSKKQIKDIITQTSFLGKT